jgi:RNA polymerase sigma-B factor
LPNLPPDAAEVRRKRTARDLQLLHEWQHVRLLSKDAPERRRLRDELTLTHLGLVHAQVSRFTPPPDTREDLVQVGTIALIQALERFDGERMTQFSTFAVPTIRGALQQYLRDRSQILRPSARWQEGRVRVLRAIDELHGLLHREPELTEIATHLDMSAEVVRELFTGPPATMQVTEEHDVWDIDRLAGVELQQSLQPFIAELASVEQQIVHLRFTHDWQQPQIAKVLGISQPHVSRLLERSLAHLRVRLQDASDLG